MVEGAGHDPDADVVGPSGGSSISPQRYDSGRSSRIQASNERPPHGVARAPRRARRRRASERTVPRATPSTHSRAARSNSQDAVRRAATSDRRVRDVGAGRQAPARLPACTHAPSTHRPRRRRADRRWDGPAGRRPRCRCDRRSSRRRSARATTSCRAPRRGRRRSAGRPSASTADASIGRRRALGARGGAAERGQQVATDEAQRHERRRLPTWVGQLGVVGDLDQPRRGGRRPRPSPRPRRIVIATASDRPSATTPRNAALGDLAGTLGACRRRRARRGRSGGRGRSAASSCARSRRR